MTNKHMKGCSTLYVIRNCKLKSQDSTTHLLEWQKSKNLTTSNAGKKVEQQGLSFVASGNAKWYSHFEEKCGTYVELK